MTYPFGCANITDFQYFVYTVMGVPASALPIVAPATVNPDVETAFCLGFDTVNPFIRQVSPHYYNLALYNWAGDWLINWAEDAECSTYFADLRKKWNITTFVAGVVASTADVSTSTALATPDNLKNLTIGDLQYLKTPYGRMYLSIAQRMGSLWGIS